MPAAAALASVPIAKGLYELAQTPVMGWQRTVRQVKGRKNPKEIVTQHSFGLRAWELAALGGIGLVGAWIILNKEGFDKFKDATTWKPLLWISPPVGAAVWLAENLGKGLAKIPAEAESIIEAVPSEAFAIGPISPALGLAVTLWDWLEPPASGPTPAPYLDIPPGPGK